MEDLSDHPADRAANPVVGISWDDPGPRHIATHSHRRGQVIYAERGCVTVEAHGASFILPPHRAARVPPEPPMPRGIHARVHSGASSSRPDLCGALPARCTIIQVDPLTRELIRTAAGMPWDYAPSGRHARLMDMLIDQLVAMPAAPLTLPDGRDARVRTVMRALRSNPADERPLSHWADVAGMSERTLARGSWPIRRSAFAPGVSSFGWSSRWSGWPRATR